MQESNERLKYYLEIWKDYMRRDAIDVGFRRKCSLFASGAMTSFEDLASDADQSAAETMDAIINGLEPHHQAAVYHCNLNAIFRFPRMDIQTVYADALILIEIGIRKKGLP